MGAECRKVEGMSFSADLAQQHPVFGSITLLRSSQYFQSSSMPLSSSSSIRRAIKRIPYSPSNHSISKRIQFSKDCSSSVSTLVQVYHYEISAKEGSGNRGQEGTGKEVAVQFEYFPPQNSLAAVLQTRSQAVNKTRLRLGEDLSWTEGVRLWDYRQIDQLPSQKRQVVNLLFQEIEVVRMVDHLVGALFFLHHYQIPHGAVRPNSVILDNEGKYLLADQQLFQLPTNYSQALHASKQQEGNFPEFLAPEWLPELQLGETSSSQDAEKADIFCVGLLALKMCLVADGETDQTERDRKEKKDRKDFSFIFDEQALSSQLKRASRRYSKQLISLLTDMLQSDPIRRVDFAHLIDQLNPVLLLNLQAIKQLHTPSAAPVQQGKGDNTLKGEQDNTPLKGNLVKGKDSLLKQNLAGIERGFRRVMNNRSLLQHRVVNQKTMRQEEEDILRQLQSLMKGKGDQVPRPKHRQRYLSGQELQQIVWREYEEMKARQSPS